MREAEDGLPGAERREQVRFSQTYGSILTVTLHSNGVPCCWSQLERAIQLCDDAFELPESRHGTNLLKRPGLLVLKANFLEESGDVAVAIAALDAALEINPLNPAVYFAKSQTLSRTNDHVGAAKILANLTAWLGEPCERCRAQVRLSVSISLCLALTLRLSFFLPLSLTRTHARAHTHTQGGSACDGVTEETVLFEGSVGPSCSMVKRAGMIVGDFQQRLAAAGVRGADEL